MESQESNNHRSVTIALLKMGGGISGLAPELLTKLPAEKMAKLNEYQNECEKQNMTPFETFTFLSKKYEEFLKEGYDVEYGTEVPDISSLIPVLLDTKNQFESSSATLRAKIPKHLEIYYNEKERLEKEMFKNELLAQVKEIQNLELTPVNDPHLESVVGKMFCISQAYNNVTFDDYYASMPDNDNLTDPDITECITCKQYFDNNREYKQHIQHSDTHKQNNIDRKKRLFEKFKEGERLAVLAQNTVNMFYTVKAEAEHDDHFGPDLNNGGGDNNDDSNVPIKRRANSHCESTGSLHVPATTANGSLNNKGSHSARRNSIDTAGISGSKTTSNGTIASNKGGSSKHPLWRMAVDRILTNRLKEHYESVTEMMSYVIPKDVKLLYNQQKYFYNIKSTFIFYFYIHLKHQCIEVIPYLFLPNQDAAAAAAAAAVEHSSAVSDKHKVPVLRISSDPQVPILKHSEIVPCNRIYLDYNVLLGHVMGNTKLDSVINSAYIADKAASSSNGQNTAITAALQSNTSNIDSARTVRSDSARTNNNNSSTGANNGSNSAVGTARLNSGNRNSGKRTTNNSNAGSGSARDSGTNSAGKVRSRTSSNAKPQSAGSDRGGVCGSKTQTQAAAASVAATGSSNSAVAEPDKQQKAQSQPQQSQDRNLIKHINESICVYIANRLKTHNLPKKIKHLPPSQQNLEASLYFDTSTSTSAATSSSTSTTSVANGDTSATTTVAEVMRSPFMSPIPSDFSEVTINIDKVYNQWAEKCRVLVNERQNKLLLHPPLAHVL